MTNTFQSFLETLNSNSAKFAVCYSAIGDEDYTDCTVEKVEEVILKLNPTSPRTITTICYLMTLYAKFIENEQMVTAIKNIDRNIVWDKAKPNVSPKFISNETFREICSSIDTFEECNALFKRVLFQCIYEGVYNDDMSVLKNLRGSDIKGNIVTLKNNSKEMRQMEISDKLARDLIELGKISTWDRKNRYGYFNIETIGEYADSCFKFEVRQGSNGSQYKHSFYRIIRDISKDYLEYTLSPSNLYLSGLMYRVCEKLKDAGFDAEKAFVKHNNSSEISSIIETELRRCGYYSTVPNFKECLRGHTDIFF